MTTFFIHNEDWEKKWRRFSKNVIILNQKVAFDDFLTATWKQEVESQRKKEAENPDLKTMISSLNLMYLLQYDKGKKQCWMFELIAMCGTIFFTVQDNMKEHSDQGVAA